MYTLLYTHTRVQVSEKLLTFLINNTGVTYPDYSYLVIVKYGREQINNLRVEIIFWVTLSEAIFVEQNREAIKIGVNPNEPKHL